ncbi:MAG: acetate--CoA ligase family protein, partial [Thaumarchaeota archaeon]|nr:acetate--CoA ligase family protein [Nitrososphaerota archaeon]
SIARKVGFPVAMKIVSPDILHKTDVGGVKLGIKSQAEVRRAFGAIIRSGKKAAGKSGIRGVYVQKMAEKSHEFVVGGIRDSQFGPAVMFGIGGIYVELFKDVTFKLAPVSKEEALLMTREIKASPLMYGFRGAKPLDVDSAVEAIQAVGRMMTDNQQIASIDINPLLVYEKGAIAVDVRVVLRK